MPEKSYLVTSTDHSRSPSTNLPTGPDCEHCVKTIFDELAHGETGIPGFVPEQSSFDIETGRLIVHSEAEIDDAVVIKAIDEAGFTATLFIPETPNAEGTI